MPPAAAGAATAEGAAGLAATAVEAERAGAGAAERAGAERAGEEERLELRGRGGRGSGGEEGVSMVLGSFTYHSDAIIMILRRHACLSRLLILTSEASLDKVVGWSLRNEELDPLPLSNYLILKLLGLLCTSTNTEE